MNGFKMLRTLLIVAAVGLVGMACEDDDDGMMMEPDPPMEPQGPTADDSPIINSTVTQVDRFGLPAINTAFVSEDMDKDVFNQSAPANDAQFVPVASGVLMARYGLNQDNADALANLVLPDVQPLGDLSGALFNGRQPSDDVIDVELGVLFGEGGLSEAAPAPGLASDNVDSNDMPFLDAFPYLATPHQ